MHAFLRGVPVDTGGQMVCEQTPWLFWHGGCAWGRRMINVLWQELVGGGGMVTPPDRALYRDDVLPLFRTQGSPRIVTTDIFPLGGWELRRLGLPRWTRRCGLMHTYLILGHDT